MSLSLTLSGAEVLTDGALHPRDLAIDGGRVVAAPVGRRVDLSGAWILPGIVDLHGDGFERHLAPRRGVLAEPAQGLAALDAELAANGITTAVLAQFFSWEGGLRGPERAAVVADALAAARGTLLTDMRLQLRIETTMVDAFDEAEALIARAGIGFVVFNDHLPHKSLAADRRPPGLTGQALKAARSPEAQWTLMQGLHAGRARVPGAVAALAGRLAEAGVRLGSHDDETPGARAAFRALGAGVAEFPVTRDTAEAARAAGDTVVMGAPNYVRGASHKGNLSAREAVAAGLSDVLVSDYHYPSLVRAALSEAARSSDWGEAWAQVSANPARALGLWDRGALAPGLRADLVVIDPATGRVGATLTGGQAAHLSGWIGARFVTAY